MPQTRGCKATLLISEFPALIMGVALCRYSSCFCNTAQPNTRPAGINPPSSAQGVCVTKNEEGLEPARSASLGNPLAEATGLSLLVDRAP